MDTTGHGAFHWNELTTWDVEGAKRFYQEAIGWTFESMPMEFGSYVVASANGKPVAGLMDANLIPDLPKEVPEHWMPYIAVDDVDKRVAKAKSAGATILREPFDVPDVGRIAILKQPGGGVIGWITPVPMP